MIGGPQYEPAGVPEPRCTDGYERLRCQAVRPGTGRDRCGGFRRLRQGKRGSRILSGFLLSATSLI